MTNHLVLLVDDDRDTRDMYRMALEMASYRVRDVSTVAGAIEAAHAMPPDAIVSDWMLPDGDGFNLLGALHRTAPMRRIPKIAVTGMSLDRDAIARAESLGCEKVLLKPISPDELIGALGASLDMRMARRLRAAAARVQRAARKPGADAAQIVRRCDTVADDVALILADDNGNYVAANNGAAGLTGYESQQLARMSVWDLTPPSGAPVGPDLWKQFIASGVQEGRYLVRRRTGESVEARYVAIANVAPGLHLSALATAVTAVFG